MSEGLAFSNESLNTAFREFQTLITAHSSGWVILEESEDFIIRANTVAGAIYLSENPIIHVKIQALCEIGPEDMFNSIISARGQSTLFPV